MQLYAQLVVNGVVDGAVFGLLALGFVLTYRASRVLNFAEAGIGALGAYVLYAVMKGSDGGAGRYTLGCLAGLGVSTAVGVLVYQVVVRPIRRAPAIASLIATVGVLLLLQAVIILVFTGNILSIPSPLPLHPVRAGSWVGLDRVVVDSRGLVLLAALVVLATVLGVVVRRTRWGLAVRAASDEFDAASELGVPVTRLGAAAWALGSAVAAVASMLYCTATVLNPVNLALLQIKALVVAVFAGLVDLRLCVLGAMALAVTESVAAQGTVDVGLSSSLAGGVSQSVAFVVLVVVLTLRGSALEDVVGDRRAS